MTSGAHQQRGGIRCYYLGGRIYPSVHAVLNMMLPSSWARRMNDEALHTGAECHAVMASHLRGDQATCYGEVEFRTAAAIRWWAASGYVAELVEQPSASRRYGYAGTPDALVRDQGGQQRWVLDWKFAESLTEANYVQVGEAYPRLDQYRGARALIVQVRKDGRVRTVRPRPNPHQWARFLGAVQTIHDRLKKEEQR